MTSFTPDLQRGLRRNLWAKWARNEITLNSVSGLVHGLSEILWKEEAEVWMQYPPHLTKSNQLTEKE